MSVKNNMAEVCELINTRANASGLSLLKIQKRMITSAHFSEEFQQAMLEENEKLAEELSTKMVENHRNQLAELTARHNVETAQLLNKQATEAAELAKFK